MGEFMNYQMLIALCTGLLVAPGCGWGQKKEETKSSRVETTHYRKDKDEEGMQTHHHKKDKDGMHHTKRHHTREQRETIREKEGGREGMKHHPRHHDSMNRKEIRESKEGKHGVQARKMKSTKETMHHGKHKTTKTMQKTTQVEPEMYGEDFLRDDEGYHHHRHHHHRHHIIVDDVDGDDGY